MTKIQVKNGTMWVAPKIDKKTKQAVKKYIKSKKK